MLVLGMFIAAACGLFAGWTLRGAMNPTTPVAETEVTEGTEGSLLGEEIYPMPDVRGLDEKTARQAIADAGFGQELITLEERESVLDAGVVVAQTPIAGTQKVDEIVLSLPKAANMPELKGKTLEAAVGALEVFGTQPKITRKYDAKIAPGNIISTNPKPGEKLDAEPELIVAAMTQSKPLDVLESTGDCSNISDGSVNGTNIAFGISCSVGEDPTESTWVLGRKLAKLDGTLGILDTAERNTSARVVLELDGKKIVDKKLSYGQSVTVDVDIVDALRLELKVTNLASKSEMESGDRVEVAFANASIHGSDDVFAELLED
ncbi:PASTA domain-containing protein [Glutamicibacter ardleyensis]|uniref:PASTA domain-containing protein n=1 Tax=Glutamicibacter ardleyensis TaxID=225894 RepID=UPI003FD66388